MPNIENLKKYKKIHMIGIGGISMSGIAEILINWGFEVSGSDRSDSEILHILDHAHIKTFIGHEAQNVEGADCVVSLCLVNQVKHRTDAWIGYGKAVGHKFIGMDYTLRLVPSSATRITTCIEITNQALDYGETSLDSGNLQSSLGSTDKREWCSSS